jgi:hypothetical protein
MGLLDRITGRQNTPASRPSGTAPARTVNLVKDPAGSSAVNLSKVRADGHIDLAKRADKAGIALSKRGLAGIRAQAMLILDHSGSMRSDYRTGRVQTLVERVLGFALQIDTDGLVPVVPFDSRVWPEVAVTVHNYAGVVDREIWQSRSMGTTDLAAALEQVKEAAETTDQPIFCAIVTDGSPDSRPATTRLVQDLSRYPVFLKFLAIREVDYLRELDDMRPDVRLVDNVDAKFFDDPAGVSDLAFADAMADEWDAWLAAAKTAGILA